MKTSLSKWLSHLYKGTTYGYATRKNCLVTQNRRKKNEK